ncbi:hypothetical protein OESDEN_20382 [Oesophagostomum dentatum]|uniref:Uncharacterized protein n=1 Tax=Oesophagostomum dentatum TaxID=61180 RepID=A0A0B1S3L5_OESDE|nr:hypothetical protein OESDEN_20382 [Oesophagostomum dentatum]
MLAELRKGCRKRGSDGIKKRIKDVEEIAREKVKDIFSDERTKDVDLLVLQTLEYHLKRFRDVAKELEIGKVQEKIKKCREQLEKASRRLLVTEVDTAGSVVRPLDGEIDKLVKVLDALELQDDLVVIWKKGQTMDDDGKNKRIMDVLRIFKVRARIQMIIQ